MSARGLLDAVYEQGRDDERRVHDVVRDREGVLEVADREHEQGKVGAERDYPVGAAGEERAPHDECNEGGTNEPGQEPDRPVAHADKVIERLAQDDGPGEPVAEVWPEPVVDVSEVAAADDEEVVVAEPVVAPVVRDRDHRNHGDDDAEEQFLYWATERGSSPLGRRFGSSVIGGSSMTGVTLANACTDPYSLRPRRC